MKKTSMKTRFILINTSHAGNVGAAARAMKVMGFDDLILVAPRWANVLRREETIQRASGALDVLKNARIVGSLAEALHGVTHACATAMTPRDFGPPTRSPREHFESFLQASARSGAEGEPCVAFLFGCERFGMSNEDVYQCHVALRIPTNPLFGSLNLAAAIQVLAYEWRLALGGFDAAESAVLSRGHDAAGLTAPKTDQVAPSAAADPLADLQMLQGALAHWQEALVALEFLDPASPKKLMPRLNQLFNRSQISASEVHILRGVAKAVLQQASKLKG
jgi:tRNA/rRNA methyltransferase